MIAAPSVAKSTGKSLMGIWISSYVSYRPLYPVVAEVHPDRHVPLTSPSLSALLTPTPLHSSYPISNKSFYRCLELATTTPRRSSGQSSRETQIPSIMSRTNYVLVLLLSSLCLSLSSPSTQSKQQRVPSTNSLHHKIKHVSHQKQNQARRQPEGEGEEEPCHARSCRGSTTFSYTQALSSSKASS